MLIAMLLAATLQFGTVKRPVFVIDVDHPKLEEVAASATAGMTKTRVGNADVYVHVPPNADDENATIDVVVAARGRLRAVHVPFYGNCAPRPPRVSLATDDPNVPIIRVDVNSPQDVVAVDQTVLLDLRGEPMATSVGAEDFEGHGRCGSPGAYYAVKTAMTCQWSATRGDFVCRQARVQIRDWNTRVAWRTFLLLRDEPIVRARDVKKPDELLTNSERTVAGEGVVESIPIADGLELFVIPSTGELFELHGWL
ncbi:MAG: hypothetical protein JWO97_257, partial [Acidobacteria bacterium]|nr:hypothetical protein [Acidobacteriota bacterium]